MISFEPTEDQAIMKDAVAQFARASLSQRARQFEQARGIDESVRRAAHEMGLGTIALPEACGGQELGMVTAVMLEEELGRADAAAAFGLPGPGAMGFVVTELASSEQQQQLIAPYCDASAHDRFGAVAWSEEAPHPERPGFCTTASKTADGWHIRGSKVFVTNAEQANDFGRWGRRGGQGEGVSLPARGPVPRSRTTALGRPRSAGSPGELRRVP